MADHDADPLILTAAFDDASARLFGDLRRRHFPAARNIVPAHLTLFHHLPGADLAACRADLDAIAPAAPLPFRTAELRFLGRGVAVAIDCCNLETVRFRLAERWDAVLTNQDRQRFKPHVTIQNKVTPAAARTLYEELADSFAPVEGFIVGLDLWHYRGGPWEPAGRVRWGDGADQNDGLTPLE